MNLERTSKKFSGDTEAAVIFSVRKLRASTDKGIRNAFRNLRTMGTLETDCDKVSKALMWDEQELWDGLEGPARVGKAMSVVGHW